MQAKTFSPIFCRLYSSMIPAIINFGQNSSFLGIFVLKTLHRRCCIFFCWHEFSLEFRLPITSKKQPMENLIQFYLFENNWTGYNKFLNFFIRVKKRSLRRFSLASSSFRTSGKSLAAMFKSFSFPSNIFAILRVFSFKFLNFWKFFGKIVFDCV